MTAPDPQGRRGRASHVPDGLATVAGVAGRLLVVALAVAAAAWLVRTLTLVVVPILVAVLVAGAFEPPVRWATRRGMPRWAASLAAVLTFVSGVVVVVSLVGVRIADQVPELTEQLAEAVQEVERRLGVALPDLPGDTGMVVPGGTVEESAGGATTAAQESVDGRGPADEGGPATTGAPARDTASADAAAGVLQRGFELLVASFLMLALAFLFLKDGATMWQWVVDKVGRAHRATVDAAGRGAWRTTGAYVRGLTVVALFDALGVGLGLLVLGVPLVLTLAALQFVLSYIPTFGALIAGAAAVAVAFVSGGFVTAALTLALVVLVQQIGNNVIEPWIMGRALALHPAVVLVAVAAGGVLWGPPGAFLAVPLVAAGAAAGRVLWERRAAPGS